VVGICWLCKCSFVKPMKKVPTKRSHEVLSLHQGVPSCWNSEKSSFFFLISAGLSSAIAFICCLDTVMLFTETSKSAKRRCSRSFLFCFFSSLVTSLSSLVIAVYASSGMPSFNTERSNTPTNESPHLIRWSRNVRGFETVCPSNHNATLQRSTARGFLSTP